MTDLTMTGQVATVMTFDLPSVLTKAEAAPTQISTSQLPFMFVRNAKVESQGRTLSYGSADLPNYRFEICVLVETLRQGNQVETYKLTRKILDELKAAIELNAAAMRLDSYNIQETFESGAADTSFFAVVAELVSS